MKNLILSILIIFSIIMPISAIAAPWMEILGFLESMAESEFNLKGINTDELGRLNELKDGLIGTHQFGDSEYNDNRFDWGAKNWQEILAMSNGKGSGDLADAVNQVKDQFSYGSSLDSKSESENKYYDLIYKTSVVSRAASDVAYKQASNEEKTISKLNGKIDTAQDEKSASDLNNRFASEQASSSLQQTKLLSVLVQQNSIDQQEKINRAKETMDFLK